MVNQLISGPDTQESKVIPGHTVDQVKGIPSIIIESYLLENLRTNQTIEGIKNEIELEIKEHHEIRNYQIEKQKRINQTIKSI